MGNYQSLVSRVAHAGSIDGAASVPLVFSFQRPHRIGSICGENCAQCDPSGTEDMIVTGIENETLPAETPFYILAPATIEDWRRSVIADGGIAGQDPPDRHFYFVSVD